MEGRWRKRTEARRAGRRAVRVVVCVRQAERRALAVRGGKQRVWNRVVQGREIGFPPKKLGGGGEARGAESEVRVEMGTGCRVSSDGRRVSLGGLITVSFCIERGVMEAEDRAARKCL